jgi:transposase
VLRIVESKGLLKGKGVGVDSTYLRADASMKAIVRKDSGLTYQEDGRTRLAYKAAHVADMETGAVRVAEIHAADQGDTATLEPNLEQARANIDAAKSTPPETAASNGEEDPTAQPPGPAVLEVVADKGYHKAELLRDLNRANYRTYISVPKHNGEHRWTDKGGIYIEHRARLLRQSYAGRSSQGACADASTR